MKAKLQLTAMIVLCVLGMAHLAAGQPVKIAVIAESQSVRVGENARFKCVLLDKDDKPVQTPKNLSLELEIKYPSGELTKTNVMIKPGQDSYSWQLPMQQAGVSEITAKHGELINRNTFIRVKGGAASHNGATNSVHAGATNGISINRSPAGVEPGPSRIETAAIERRVGESAFMARTNSPTAVRPAPTIASAARRSMAAVIRPEGAVEAATSAAPASGKPLGLILKWGSERHLADGEDAASIYAFLDENTSEAPVNIVVTLFNRAGKMLPIPLTIAKGSDNAEAKVTSDHVGDVAVEFVKSSPQALVQGPKDISISFRPPITTLEVHGRPLTISLLEKCDLVVRLLDKHGVPVATDEERRVSLTVDSGGGSVGTPDIVIATNRSDARVTFTPVRWGKATIRASTPNLFDSTTDVTITLPALLLTLSAIGGLLGGGIALYFGEKGANSPTTSKASKVRRIALGIVTGFVFYWGCIFVNSYVKLPPATVLNPISTVVLAMLGGFTGIKTLSGILSLLGRN